MDIPFLNLKYQHQQIKEEVFSALEELYDRTEFAYGKTGKEFESNFAAFNNTEYACAVDNGTMALELCLRSAGIGSGDEVITVSNTFIATVAAIHFTGATPVLAEIHPDTWNIDPERIEEKITPKTKAIIPVHLYGQPADMTRIRDIARKHNLIVIGDSAQAIGSKIRENSEWHSVSRYADMSAYSFYAGKNLGACGEAGAVVTDNPDYAQFISMFRDHGSKEKYIHEFIGKNNRIDAFQAAVLKVKLQYIEEWNSKRQQVADWYFQELGDVEELKLPTVLPDVLPVYHLFVVLADNRNEFQDFLAQKGVGTALHYKLPVHLQQAFSHLGYVKGDLPVTETVVKKNVSLPMFPELSQEEVHYVAEVIKGYFVK